MFDALGIKFDFEDLIGIARLRGSGMKRLEISSSNIVKLFDVQNTNFWESRNLFPTEMKSFSKVSVFDLHILSK